MSVDDLLFAIDGLYGQVAIAKQLAEAKGESTLPFDSLAASIMMIREAVGEPAAEAPTGGECPHPADAVRKTAVGGGNWFMTCTACNEIIEQSSDSETD